MKLIKLCCLLFLILVSTGARAQINSPDSAIVKDTLQNDTIAILQNDRGKMILSYLVISAKDDFHRSRVFKENKRLMIKTYDNRKLRGRLKILNDSTIYLCNTFSGKTDTFKLSEIRIIRNVSLVTNVIAAYHFILAPFFILSGISIISSPGFIFDESFGAFMIAVGIAAIGVSSLYFNGYGLSRQDFDYHIHHAKGYILKPHMVKYLYPPSR